MGFRRFEHGLDADSRPLLAVKCISKRYGVTLAVDGLSLTVQRGEIFGLLGPSGCGKTTTLRLVLGIEVPDQGVIEFADRDITAAAPEARGFGMVFQNYALFTKLNVFENVAFGLEARTRTATELREQVDRWLALVRLPDYASRRVDELSAGEQQRVAIARAVAIEPSLLLLDEPLANLDVGLRRQTGEEIRQIIKRLNIAAIYVTHDRSEAFTLCDRIAVMSNGRILQTGSPLDLYEHPSQLFVAQFLGFNIVPARRVGANSDAVAEFEMLDGGWRLHVLGSSDELWPEYDRCVLAIRPEDIHVGIEERGVGNPLLATVREVVFAGPITRLALDVGGLALEALVLRGIGISPGDQCVIEISPDRPVVFPLTP
jgi:ABC-type Fe3+/spermidine/putrescine transport system ATPase subunit